MIDPALLPDWAELYSRMGGPAPRRNRGQCLIHGGDSLTSVSLDHDHGLYHCHVCGAGGDRLDWIMRVLDTDFAGALRWLGIEPGRPPQPDPESIRRRREREEIAAWARRTGRRLRAEFRTREIVVTRAEERLRRDPDDSWAWAWLSWALRLKDWIEYLLNVIDIGNPEEQAAMYYEVQRDRDSRRRAA